MTENMEKELLFGKTLSELHEIVASLNLPKYTAGQMAQWLYQKEVTTFDEMTNLSKAARLSLSEKYEVGADHPVSVQVSSDGTKKYLFKTPEGGYIEAAYIPEKKRSTLCVSSQVGCKMRCLFCMTGKQGFQAQLTAGEILNQISRLPERQNLTNLVYMGMGEPMDNLDAVMKSLEILTADWGYGWSHKKITVSTIGLVPEMKHYLENTNCHLAVSLHSPFEKERRMLMPVSQKYSIEDIMKELKKHSFDRQRRVSFEYIVFSGQNDTKAHVKEMARILNGLKCRVNLIRFHTIPNTPLPATTEESILQFKEALLDKGIMTTIRASRGQDIDAACGLLSTREMKNTVQTNALKITPNQ